MQEKLIVFIFKSKSNKVIKHVIVKVNKNNKTTVLLQSFLLVSNFFITSFSYSKDKSKITNNINTDEDIKSMMQIKKYKNEVHDRIKKRKNSTTTYSLQKLLLCY
jgi:hypothetical protein